MDKNNNQFISLNLDSQPNALTQMYNDDLRKSQESEELEKGGEGSKGRKIIGHTISGKPIYASYGANDYEGFSKEDHEGGALHHSREANKYGKGTNKRAFHEAKATSHKKQMGEESEKKSEVKKSYTPESIFKFKQAIDTHILEGKPVVEIKKAIEDYGNLYFNVETEKYELIEDFDTIMKGEVLDRLGYETDLKIVKTGAELKSSIESVIERLTSEKQSLETLMSSTLQSIDGITPSTPVSDYYYRGRKNEIGPKFEFSYEQYSSSERLQPTGEILVEDENAVCITPEQKRACRTYNELQSKCIDVCVDILRLGVYMRNLEDEKSYSLTPEAAGLLGF